MQEQQVTSATVITHGFQFPVLGSGDSLYRLADAIHSKAERENPANERAWLLDYDLEGFPTDGVFRVDDEDTKDSILPDTNGLTGDVVLLFDWAPESDELSAGWAEAAGDALFSLLIELGFVDPQTRTSVPTHFIGHSFGAAVTSEAVERLAAYSVPVDHVTYLDPHDFDQGLLFDNAQRLSELGRPDGYGVSVWDNVEFTDVFYQTRGSASGSLAPDESIPQGRPIPGAYNRFLADGLELPATNDELFGPYALNYVAGDHSWVWDGFYRATVMGEWPLELPLPERIESIDLSSTGYAFSGVTRPQTTIYPSLTDSSNASFLFRSNPNNAQDHEFTPRTPITDNLQNLSIEELNTGSWEPEWNPLTDAIFNGDLELGGTGNLSGPGWNNHGGESQSYDLIGGPVYQIDEGLGHLGERSVFNFTTLRHNRLYFPPTVESVRVDYDITDDSIDDKIEFLVGGNLIGDLSLDRRLSGTIIFPVKNFADTVNSLAIRLKHNGHIDSDVYIRQIVFRYDSFSTENQLPLIEAFDHYPSDRFPPAGSSWQITTLDANTSITIDQSVFFGASGKSIHFIDNNTAGSGSIRQSFTEATEVTLDYYMRSDDASREGAFVGLSGDVGNDLYVAFRKDGFVGILRDDRWHAAQFLPYEEGKWYHVRRHWDAATNAGSVYVAEVDASGQDVPEKSKTLEGVISYAANNLVNQITLWTSGLERADAYIDKLSLTTATGSVPPLLASIEDKSVDEGDELRFIAPTVDDDPLPSSMKFVLSGTVPSGISLNETSGEFRWTPTESQGPKEYSISLCVVERATEAVINCESLSVVVLDEHPHQNYAKPNDVNGDESISPIDVLLIVNDINSNGARSLIQSTVESYLDVNGDGFVSPLDALIVINFLEANHENAEGESVFSIDDPRSLVVRLEAGTNDVQGDSTALTRTHDKQSSWEEMNELCWTSMEDDMPCYWSDEMLSVCGDLLTDVQRLDDTLISAIGMQNDLDILSRCYLSEELE